MSGRSRGVVLVAVALMAVVGMSLGFAAAAMPADDPADTDREDPVPEFEMDDGDSGYDVSDLEQDWSGAEIDSSLLEETGETVVILDVERSIDRDAVAGDATSLLKADSEATLEPVAEEVSALESATVRNELWLGNLLTVEVDLDRHDVEELARIDGVQRVISNVEFELPEPPEATTDAGTEQDNSDADTEQDSYDVAVVGSTAQPNSSYGMDYMQTVLSENLDDGTYSVEAVHPNPDEEHPQEENILELMDQYDAFVVNTMGGIDSELILDDFLDNLTANQTAVYLDAYNNADAIEELSEVRNNPENAGDDLIEDTEASFVELNVTKDHPIFEGLGSVGERIPVRSVPQGSTDYVLYSTFSGYSGEMLADVAPDNGDAFGPGAAVDNESGEVLLSIGQGDSISSWYDEGTQTESAEQLLVNAVQYVTTEVEPPDDEPVDMDVTYGLEQMDIPGFEDEFGGERGGNATVAIVDNGLSSPEEGHPDLDIAQKYLVQDGEVTEGIVEYGTHGEHVAGTATGAANPVGDVPRFGVAPEAELLMIDVFGETSGASFEDITIGLQLAAEEGADVGGFSLGAANPDFEESTFQPTFTSTVEDANAAGMVVSVSAGNEGLGPVGGQVTSPGTQFDSFTVGASTEDRGIATFSSGAVISDDTVLTVGGDPVDLPEHFPREYVKPDVSAAGQTVLSSGPLGGDIGDPAATYSYSDGTSMAQPHIAGAAALLQSVTEAQLTPDQIETALAETAEKPADAPGAANERDIRYGTGIINVTAAALALEDAQTVNGTVTSSATGEPIVGATIESAAGALDTARAGGEYAVYPTSNPAELTADAFGFVPETIEVGGSSSVSGAGAVTDQDLSASGAENLTVVDFGWVAECPDEEVAGLGEYFDGDISESDDDFHLDNANGADDEPPASGCVLRTEGENASVVSTPGDQSKDLEYYPQRGDNLSWNHYVHNIDPIGGSNPADFEFRFGLQNDSNYYFVTIAADETPYELVVGEVSGDSVVTEDRVNINETLAAGTFQPVEVDWGESTIEASFGVQTVSIDSSSFDGGGIGFARQGTSGIVYSYTNLVDGVFADAAPHLQVTDLDYPGTVAPDENLTVEYTVENQGVRTLTESEVGLFVGSATADTDTNVTLGPGETTSGTLTYESAGEYEDGDSFDFTVELGDWNDAVEGGVDVAESSNPGSDFELDPTVDAELLQGQPSFVVTGDSFDIVANVANLENITVELTAGSQVAAEDLTVLLGDQELPLGETVDLGESVTGEVTLTVETDAGIADGSSFGLLHTLAGAGDELTVETGPTEVVNEVPPAAFEVTDVSVPETITMEETIPIVAEVKNVGGQTGEVETMTAIQDAETSGEDDFIFFPPEPIELDPGETITLPTDFPSIEAINDQLGTEFGPGDEFEAVQQVGENLDPSEDPAPEIEDEETAPFLVVEEQIEGPFFAVSDLQAPAQADPGEAIDVSATITNIGNQSDTQDVEFVFDGTVVDTKTDVQLDSEDNTTIEFTGIELPTEENIYEHGVFTEDDNETATIEVGEPEPPEFVLSNFSQPDILTVTDEIAAEVEVTNVGGSTGEAEVLYGTDIDGNFVFIPDNIQSIELDVGESTTIQQSLLTFEEINNQLGTGYGPGDDVLTGFQVGQNLNPSEDPEPDIDDQAAENISLVQDETFFAVSDLDAPLEAEPGTAISVSATITNLGGTLDTQDVVFQFEGEPVATESNVSLDAGESTTVEFTNVPLPDESGIYEHGVFTEDDNQTAGIGVGVELSTVTVVGSGDGFGAATLDIFAGDLAPEFVPTFVNASNVTDAVINETDVFVFHDLGGADSTEIITAVESDDDTDAVYLDQWGEESDAIPARSGVTGDPASAEEAYNQAPPVEFAIQADHPIFDGVGEPGDTVPIHAVDFGDHTWFEGAAGETLAEVQDQDGSGGAAVAVDPDSGSVLLSSIAVTSFVPSTEYSDQAGQILANAVDVAASDGLQQPFFEVSNLTAPAEAEEGALIDVSGTITNTGGSAGTQDVAFVFDGTTVANETVSLNASATQTVTFTDVPLPETTGVFEHGISTANDSQTAEIAVGDVTTVTVVEFVESGESTGYGEETLGLFEDELSSEFVTQVVTAGSVTEEVVNATDVFVFHSFAAAGESEARTRGGDLGASDSAVAGGVTPANADLIAAVENDSSTGAVYLDQWGPDSNAIPARSNAIDDPVNTSQSAFGGGPVEYSIQADHPIFDGVGSAGDAIPIHTGSAADHTWFTNASGETLAEVQDQNGSGGAAVAVDPDSGSVLLSSIAVFEFVGATNYTAEAGQILANAVDVAAPEAEPPAVSLSGMDIAGQGENATVLAGDHDVAVGMAHVGGGTGEVTMNLTIGDTELTETVSVGANESVMVTFENATSGVSPGLYDVTASTDDNELVGTLMVSVDANGDGNPATDTTGDGLLNDVDGGGTFDIFDVQTLFNTFSSAAVQDNPALFNFNDDDPPVVSIFDVQGLFNQLQAQG